MNDESDSGFIVFRCKCGQKIKVPAEHAGAKGRCKTCGHRLIVPTPEREDRYMDVPERVDQYASPHHIRDLEGDYSVDDLITYPRQRSPRQEAPPPPVIFDESKSLLELLGEILRYPIADKLAVQIFSTGVFIFSPVVWKFLWIAKIFPSMCCFRYLVIGFIVLSILTIRLMYFSYLLLIIERSAVGDNKIPDLPVFQSWEENLKDMLKILAATFVAFLPFLLYAASVNMAVYMTMLEAYNRGDVPGTEALTDVSSSLGGLVLLYAVAAFYMPMVLMALVVTGKFTKAVNPLFIFRSIFRIGREYLVAMFIIFIVLGGGRTLFSILNDLLMMEWFEAVAKYILEPTVTFYVFVVTMHIIGLLYYRNAKKLQW